MAIPMGPWGGLVLLLLALLTLDVVRMYMRGKRFRKESFKKHCVHSDFCGLRTLVLPFPHGERVLDLVASTAGIHVDFGYRRRGTTFDSNTIHRALPEVVAYAQSLRPMLSRLVGEPLEMTEARNPTTISIIHYNGDGEGIDWHYDLNHYVGRFFTLIIPIQTLGSGRFEYLDPQGRVQRVDPLLAVFFEGDDVFHRGSENYNGVRTILSIQYATNGGRQSMYGKLRRWIKDQAFAPLQTFGNLL